jgi:membrane protein DedA with SNARE-associated domain
MRFSGDAAGEGREGEPLCVAIVVAVTVVGCSMTYGFGHVWGMSIELFDKNRNRS